MKIVKYKLQQYEISLLLIYKGLMSLGINLNPDFNSILLFEEGSHHTSPNTKANVSISV